MIYQVIVKRNDKPGVDTYTIGDSQVTADARAHDLLDAMRGQCDGFVVVLDDTGRMPRTVWRGRMHKGYKWTGPEG